ncbi:MAG: ribosome silencing factor [Candidatus Gastranaerophilaceae bacterium]
MSEEVSAYKTACIAAGTLDDKSGQDIVILDISKISVLADYFVICSANTSTQVKALTEYVRKRIKELFGRIPVGEENDLRNRWNLLDYGDVVVHVLNREEREIYALEKFWNHALRIEKEQWNEIAKDFSEYKDVRI